MCISSGDSGSGSLSGEQVLMSMACRLSFITGENAQPMTAAMLKRSVLSLSLLYQSVISLLVSMPVFMKKLAAPEVIPLMY